MMIQRPMNKKKDYCEDGIRRRGRGERRRGGGGGEGGRGDETERKRY